MRKLTASEVITSLIISILFIGMMWVGVTHKISAKENKAIADNFQNWKK